MTVAARLLPKDGVQVARRRWVVLVILALVIWGYVYLRKEIFRSPVPQVVHRPWAAELGRVRLIEGRLAGGFLYAPARSLQKVDRPSSKILEKVYSEYKDNLPASPEAKADLAIINLWGNHLDKAVSLLESACSQTKSPALWSDLSAAYLTRAVEAGRPFDLLLALSAVDQAIQSGPQVPEALFNRALILGKLSLVEEAIQAWRLYILKEEDEDWRREGQERLDSLFQPGAAERWAVAKEDLRQSVSGSVTIDVRQVVRHFPQSARLYAEEVLLQEWAQGTLDGDLDKSKRVLSLARSIGRALSVQHGDVMLKESVEAIDRARLSGATSHLYVLAKGHVEFGLGLQAFARYDGLGAGKHFEAARYALLKGGSPFQLWAEFYKGGSLYLIPHYDQALVTLEPLLKAVPEKKYPSLAGRLHWAVGLIYSVQSEVALAQSHYEMSYAAFERIGEVEHSAYIHFLLSENLGDLGRDEDAWRERYRALSARKFIANPRRFHNIAFNFAEAALQSGKPEVAIYFHDVMVRLASQQDDLLSEAEALLRRSRTLGRLGRRDAMERDLSGAQEVAAKIYAPGVRRRLETDILLARSDLEVLKKPDEAIAAFSNALHTDKDNSYHPRRVQMYRQRALAYRAAGRTSAAEADFYKAIAEIEQERGKLPAGEFREDYLNQARETYDDAIVFQFLNQKEPLEALDLSERARARSLLESASIVRSQEVLSNSQLQEKILANQAMVEYAVVDDYLFIWVIQRQVIQPVALKVSSKKIESTVQALKKAAQERNAEAVRRGLIQLHDMLFAPIKRLLPATVDLVFIPDKWLYEVPFGALYNSVTKEFLSERYIVSICPSASLYVRLTEKAAELSSTTKLASALIIGNPAFDRSLLSNLSNLPYSAEEAQLIAAIYPDSLLLLGALASEERFLSLAKQVQVIHFSGHSLLESRSDLANLVLAPDSGHASDGLVSALAISRLSLPQVRLVVLAGCSTATGRIGQGEGALSMARAFLSAGSPTVVANIFPQPDNISFEEFHRLVSTGLSAQAALREMQLRDLRLKDKPFLQGLGWFGIQVIGA